MPHFTIAYTMIGGLDLYDIFKQTLDFIIQADNLNDAIDILIDEINNDKVIIKGQWGKTTNIKTELLSRLFYKKEAHKHILSLENMSSCYEFTPEYHVAYAQYIEENKKLTRDMFDEANVLHLKNNNVLNIFTLTEVELRKSKRKKTVKQ